MSLKLTADERRLADYMARHHVYDGEAFDAAWESALAFIAARRKAFGITEEPASATAAGEASVATVRQSVISDMADILTSTADADERHAAAVTMVDALCHEYKIASTTEMDSDENDAAAQLQNGETMELGEAVEPRERLDHIVVEFDIHPPQTVELGGSTSQEPRVITEEQREEAWVCLFLRLSQLLERIDSIWGPGYERKPYSHPVATALRKACLSGPLWGRQKALSEMLTAIGAAVGAAMPDTFVNDEARADFMRWHVDAAMGDVMSDELWIGLVDEEIDSLEFAWNYGGLQFSSDGRAKTFKNLVDRVRLIPSEAQLVTLQGRVGPRHEEPKHENEQS